MPPPSTCHLATGSLDHILDSGPPAVIVLYRSVYGYVGRRIVVGLEVPLFRTPVLVLGTTGSSSSATEYL